MYIKDIHFLGFLGIQDSLFSLFMMNLFFRIWHVGFVIVELLLLLIFKPRDLCVCMAYVQMLLYNFIKYIVVNMEKIRAGDVTCEDEQCSFDSVKVPIIFIMIHTLLFNPRNLYVYFTMS